MSKLGALQKVMQLLASKPKPRPPESDISRFFDDVLNSTKPPEPFQDTLATPYIHGEFRPSRFNYAEGGAISDEEYLRRLRGMKPVSGGRRPERLNASRGVNAPLQLLRGWAAGTAGLPGDIEGLGRMLIPGISNEPFLPTSEFYQEWLPGGDTSPAGKFFGGMGSLAGGAGSTKIAGGLNTLANKAAANLDAAAKPGNRMARVGQRGAVRVKGGNFDQRSVDQLIEELKTRPGMGDVGEVTPHDTWMEKQLRNYIRKDLGSATDPLLQVEKEYPRLHLPEGRLQSQEFIDRAFNEPYRMSELLRKHSTENPDAMYPSGYNKRVMQRHVEVAGDTPLTPWGRHSSDFVGEDTAGRNLLTELADEHSLPGVARPWIEDQGGNLDDALRLLEERREDLHYGLNKQGKENLARFEAAAAKAKESDWRAKQPDAKIFALDSSQDLGFDHVLDYLRTATKAHEDSLLDPQLMNELGGERYADIIPRAQRLRDAGLTLDPKSLERLSVPDAVRKTAQWNEFLANQDAADGPLSKGWKEFKAYPDDPKGMKWVEFGKPKNEFTADTLPEGYAIHEPRPGRFVVEQEGSIGAADTAPSPEDALRDFNTRYGANDVREGLAAEGDAMGHCVGGYCDDVLGGDTQIYSLRDAKGRPHVTIETRGRQPRSELEFDQLDELIGLNSPYETEMSDRLRNRFGDRDPTPLDWLRDITTNHPDPRVRIKAVNMLNDYEQSPRQIIQIKGKSNDPPIADYLPYVQDFVKSGKWGRVGDLRNAKLVKYKDDYDTPENLWKRVDEHPRYQEMLAKHRQSPYERGSAGYGAIEHRDVFDPVTALEMLDDPAFDLDKYRGRAEGGSVRRGYAKGGSVQAEPEDPPGFYPRSMEEWAAYLGDRHAAAA